MTRPDVQPTDESEQLYRFLASPQAYPEPTTAVQSVETHISRLFLSDRFVYKLKKPVRFDFLDFSTSERRHQACLAELELNRRLAGDVYFDVLSVTRSTDGGLAIRGDGVPVDWLVKMRRLNDADTLLTAIHQGTVAPAAIDSLARLLATFYRSQPSLSLSADDYRLQIEQHVRANFTELLAEERQFPRHTVRRICSAQLTYLALHPHEFDARVTAGRVVEGHGDLRPEHIYLTSPPVVIDCIEFNAEFRQVDVLDELSFLEAECSRLQAGAIGAAIREKCLAILNDQTPQELAAFYKSYRAGVRAKVALLRAKQLTSAAARQPLSIAAQYLDLADRFDEALGRPLVLLVRGLSGTGKSTVAQGLAERLGIETLHTDAVRQGRVGQGKLSSESETDKYSLGNRQRVYDEMLLAAEQLLAGHASVILDGTFLSSGNIARVGRLAERHGARWLIVHCHCPVAIAQQRIAARLDHGSSHSEARPELVEKQVDFQENDSAEWPTVHCDTTRPSSVLVQDIIEHLQRT